MCWSSERSIGGCDFLIRVKVSGWENPGRFVSRETLLLVQPRDTSWEKEAEGTCGQPQGPHATPPNPLPLQIRGQHFRAGRVALRQLLDSGEDSGFDLTCQQGDFGGHHAIVVEW